VDVLGGAGAIVARQKQADEMLEGELLHMETYPG
jgi:hypothetical protein